MNQKITIRLKTRVLPALVGILLAVQIIAPNDGWMILLVGLGAAWLGSYLWVRALARHLRIRREMRFGWAQVGDRLEERFTLSDSSWLPALWVEVADHSNMPDYQVGRVTAVGGSSENRWLTQSVCQRRGVYSLGPTSLRSGDPFGIYSLEIHDPRQVNLMVTPPVVPLPTIEVAPGGRSGEGRPKPDAPERTVSAATVREYAPGDSLRWVHWRTTARKGRYFVRLFEGTPAGDWWIVLDLDQSVQVGSDQDSTLEHAIILAASLADRGLRMRRAVGLAANGSQLSWVPPRQGSGQRWEILRSLALVTPGKRSLSDLLARMKPAFGRQASLLIITPNVREDWTESLLSLIWTGAVPTVLLLDPLSYGSDENPAGMVSALHQMGIAHNLIPRQLLERPEARPGQTGVWEWRISPTGRAIPVRKPQDFSWKELI